MQIEKQEVNMTWIARLTMCGFADKVFYIALRFRGSSKGVCVWGGGGGGEGEGVGVEEWVHNLVLIKEVFHCANLNIDKSTCHRTITALLPCSRRRTK